MFSKTKSRRKRSLHGSSPGRPIRQVVRRLGREYLLCYVKTAPYNTFSLRFFLEQKLTHLFILPPTSRILTHDVHNACLYITHFGLLLSWHFHYWGCFTRSAVALLLDTIRFLIMNQKLYIFFFCRLAITYCMHGRNRYSSPTRISHILVRKVYILKTAGISQLCLRDPRLLFF